MVRVTISVPGMTQSGAWWETEWDIPDVMYRIRMGEGVVHSLPYAVQMMGTGIEKKGTVEPPN